MLARMVGHFFPRPNGPFLILGLIKLFGRCPYGNNTFQKEFPLSQISQSIRRIPTDKTKIKIGTEICCWKWCYLVARFPEMQVPAF